MDKLLTIKEAASFLKVSTMSLRRWTNDGKLKCYRVGGNRERRFERQDLLNFLHPEHNRKTPLGLADHKVGNSAHIAQFYQSLDESITAGISYLGKGLALGEKALIVSTASRLTNLLDGLKKQGLPVSNLLADGSITIDTGRAKPTEQIQFMTKAISAAHSPNGFRLLGDMVWTQEQNWGISYITTLENYTNNTLANPNRIFLCQYDLCKFDASSALMAFETHSLVTYRNNLQESPYFASGYLKTQPE